MFFNFCYEILLVSFLLLFCQSFISLIPCSRLAKLTNSKHSTHHFFVFYTLTNVQIFDLTHKRKGERSERRDPIPIHHNTKN